MSYNEQQFLRAPIIFVGPGRSGSTIVSEVLFAHEDLAWPTNYQEYFPSLSAVNLIRRLFDNPFWHVVGEKGQLNPTHFLNTLIPYPAEAYSFWDAITRPDIDFSRGFLLGESATPEEQALIRHTIARLIRWQGKPRFAMKTTGPGRIEYLKSIFPDACFVNVIRDPVATVHSLLNVSFWKDQGSRQLWWRGAYDEVEIDRFYSIKNDPIACTAFQLAKVLETTSQEAQQCNAQVLTIRYEDFVSYPRDIVKQICAFTDLKFSERLENKLQKTAVHDRNKQRRTFDKKAEKVILSYLNSSISGSKMTGLTMSGLNVDVEEEVRS
ncbi:sulfotransferase [Pseudomonadota bacterium]